MKLWKALGLAAFVGVAATGVVVARDERRRRGYTPEEVRERLHARYAQIADERDGAPRGGGRLTRADERGHVTHRDPEAITERRTPAR